MKKTTFMLPLLVLGSLFLKAVAQPVMAEHRFCADPARYQYRLTDMKNCYGQDITIMTMPTAW